MKWNDIYQISESLSENYINWSKTQIINIRFTELQKMIKNLPDFQDSETNCNEKILEAIQATWLEEHDD